MIYTAITKGDTYYNIQDFRNKNKLFDYIIKKIYYYYSYIDLPYEESYIMNKLIDIINHLCYNNIINIYKLPEEALYIATKLTFMTNYNIVDDNYTPLFTEDDAYEHCKINIEKEQ